MLHEPELIESPAAARRTRFGAFEADSRSGELVKNGRRVRLQEQPFQLLAALLERPGEVVTREELRTLLWPQTVVDYDHGLNKAVSKIREALGDSAESPRFVETVARRGYRFLADVTVVDGSVPSEPVSTPSPPQAAPSARPVTRQRPGLVASLGLALLLAVALSAWLYPWHQGKQAIHSLAVLPLVDTSEDPSQDFFADGMTGELITELGKVDSLRVISRTSAMTYKGAHKPLATIARELNVDAVIEGSVMRAKGRVRISAQLIRAGDDTRVWADTYEGDVRDALTLQVDIARAVAGQVRATLNRGERTALARARSLDPLAYEDYLKGRFFLNKRTGDGLKAAIKYFREAIAIDPSYAEAHSGLADAYALAGDWEYGVLST
ncbi:winged helix-turn-helix domain-containing protein, partial [Bradyrhizobium campsiandrae]